ncbi:MAG: hypothetical protein GFH27_549327n52 [Chloroflexi bacterium AL-W]|nr:hypothetical protein [Chloroflexi bacterium AL-N1]NOK69664.1 hypothetical protein [Chloroflexi bacterium AL-N10]NOK72211.1 hypothetical protein [Chloroflexi bacterium AL-N5]NOK85040.1 hypothetical protein [Chloroflexi bacterium AL-W]NOK91793.1 hypothetical protein [Chloroflexi bacterium AL-N15]
MVAGDQTELAPSDGIVQIHQYDGSMVIMKAERLIPHGWVATGGGRPIWLGEAIPEVECRRAGDGVGLLKATPVPRLVG